MKLMAFLLMSLALMAGAPVTAQSAAAQNGVLVELFTSQGCSSCPPAERVFNRMEQVAEGAIPLAYHVDYWDYLGWKDPFAALEWTERQKQYGAVFKLRSIYTPQAVVAGRAQLNGSDGAAISRAVDKEAKTAVSFDLKTYQPTEGLKTGVVGLSIRMNCANPPPGDLMVFVAVAENGFSTQVKAGENTGRKLDGNHIVRRLVEAASLTPEVAAREGGFSRDMTIILDSAWKRDNLELVIFAQGMDDMGVLGAARLSLESQK